jgi:putative ABC transport system ATP-binding protein
VSGILAAVTGALAHTPMALIRTWGKAMRIEDLTAAGSGPPPSGLDGGPPGAAVSVRGLRHAYPTPRGPLTVLDGLDLDVAGGAYVALTGPSGSGKSTLLAVLGGLERPQAGTVEVGGHDLARLAGDALAAHRRALVGFVFQHFGLIETLTAAENVELACALAGLGRAQRRRRAAELLGAVGLGERAGHRSAQLSGGERQRVAIARALANQPRLILADEPTGNLDIDAGRRVIELLETARGERGCTLLIVTHDRGIAARAERRLALGGGRLTDAGAAA